MPPLPVDKREARAFISHSSKDKAIANQLNFWLTEVAGMKTWYDSDAIGGGDPFIKNLEEGIPASRSLILLHSQASSQSTWVRREVERALNHQVQYAQFRIIPVRLDDTPLDGFLSEMQAIDLLGEMDLDFCRRLLRGLYPGDLPVDSADTKDVYISYGWHETEQSCLKYISQFFIREQFRLVGDAKDQPKFKGREQRERIQEIMLSCRGFLAVVPYRADTEYNDFGHTSKYIVREIEWAAAVGLPIVIIKDPRVELDPKHTEAAQCIAEFEMDANFRKADASPIENARQQLKDSLLKEARKEHFVFYATDIRAENALRNKAIREVVQRVTAMPCKFGEVIHERNDIYRVIIDQIKNAFVMISDLTEYRPNILIESGIAIGADVHIYYVQSGEVHRPPVMLGDPQVHTYSNEVQLLGKTHRIIYPYRRTILNNELT